MQRILLVRLSALGDIIHSLPVIADITRRWPDAIIDMATDERFTEIPQLNTHVRKVIGLPLKRAKKNLFCKKTWAELRAIIRDLRKEHYDIILDLHGLIKSAAVARLARGKIRIGFDASQCGEKPAALCYHKHFLPTEIPNRVDWLRQLAAFAVSSDSKNTLDYGLPTIPANIKPQRSIVFFHSTADHARTWPEANWVALGQSLISQNWRIELPWGNASEKERALRIQQQLGVEHADLAPFRSLTEWVQHFSELTLAVGLDTGLTHLAAAVGLPCVGIFTITCPNLLVPQKPELAKVLGGNGYVPNTEEVLHACQSLFNEIEIPSALNIKTDQIG